MGGFGRREKVGKRGLLDLGESGEESGKNNLITVES